jgi:hypothetical protein
MRMVALLALVVVAGCGEGARRLPTVEDYTGKRDATSQKPAKKLRLARCPKAASNCAASLGRVIYIESVDPDGDGDLHVVALVSKGKVVTGAGITVFDVSKDVRPKKDPKLGATVTGAGPVYRGSHGQDQIQVTSFHVRR